MTTEPERQTRASQIPWSHDVEAALRDAKQAGQLVLLDFTAAPM